NLNKSDIWEGDYSNVIETVTYDPGTFFIQFQQTGINYGNYTFSQQGNLTQGTYRFGTLPLGPLNIPREVINLNGDSFFYDLQGPNFNLYSLGIHDGYGYTRYYQKMVPVPVKKKSWSDLKSRYRN